MSNFFPETLEHCSLPLAPGENHLGTPRGCGDPKNNRPSWGKIPLEDSVLSSPCPNLPTGFHPNPSPLQLPVLPKSVGPAEGLGGPFCNVHPFPSFPQSSLPPPLQSCKRGSGESLLPQTIQDSFASPPPPLSTPSPSWFCATKAKGKKRPGKRGEGAT